MRASLWILTSSLLSFAAGGLEGGESLRWQAEREYRWAELTVAPSQRTGFTLLPSERTGLAFTNAVDELASAANRVLINGAGLATGDFDGDGWVDIFFCNLQGRSALYRNLGGLRFEDVTEAAGVGLSNRITRGAVFADVNGDGRLDLLVSTLAQGVVCFINEGQGKFADLTALAGTGSNAGSVTLALADVDGNGTLDLYVTNYRSEDIRDRGQVDLFMVKGKMVVPPRLKDRLLVVGSEVLEYGEPDRLLLNDGNGRFRPVSWTGGAFLDEEGKPLTEAPLDWGLTATFRDMTGNGLPDLYVCNDYWTPDRVWINQGQGRFRAIDRLAVRSTSSSSMGVDFADIDRDGHLDFIVTDMLSRDPRLRKRQMPARWPIPEPVQLIDFRPQIIQNTLLHNRGDGTYQEIAYYAGVAASDWTWQPLFLDIDLDGYPDLLVSAGHLRDVQDMDAEREIRSRQRSWRGMSNPAERQQAFTRELMVHMRLYPRLEMPIFAFRNTGQLQFEESTGLWGTSQPGVHHCMALADFDNDGDLDFVVNNLGSAAGFYRNDTGAARVAVRLKGLAPNTQGIGAHVTLLNGAIPMQSQEVIAGGSYMSGSDPLVVFAGGKAGVESSLVVRWRNGRTSRIEGVRANRIYEIDESGAGEGAKAETGGAAGSSTQTGAEGNALFRDVSGLIEHMHQETLFDDFARQPLLPKRLSQLGPGVAWFDLDGDGWDDLIVGSGRGGRMSVFLNDRQGGFKPLNEPPFAAPVTRDQTAVVGLRDGEGKALVLAGSSNYEDGLASGPAVRQFDPAGKRIDDRLPGHLSSTGPVALADLDGDGDLDIFIGGRALPGRYPEPASSLVLRQTGGRWVLDEENTKVLRNAGLVSGAVWSDLDGDGLPELLLACEWGPIRVFQNDAGRLRETTAALGLQRLTGWWTGLNTADLDGDGRLDIIAGNWGLNTGYQTPENPHPVRLYFGDIAGAGMVDLLEAEYDPVMRQYAPRRRLDVLAPMLPFLSERFPTFKAFSEAPITHFFGPGRPEPRWVEATTLASMVFFNRGDRFEPVPLPYPAQLTAAFAVQVADFNGDGAEDLFLSQNFFGMEPETPRLDAGRGLLLLGDGKGGLRPVPGQESGIAIYGEQRGAAVSDFNQDGRVDLVVTQNAAPTRLFQNRGATPGLRVRLQGPPGNPAAIGAALRLIFSNGAGPVREIKAGAGYWSQDSAIQVLSMPEPPRELWVRWPGGQITTTPLENAQGEIRLSFGL